MGGDEFLAVMHRVEAGEVLRVLERVRTRMAGEVVSGRIPAEISVSIGVALASDGGGSEDLVVRADEALYMAKREGRDRVVLWAPPVIAPPTS